MTPVGYALIAHNSGAASYRIDDDPALVALSGLSVIGRTFNDLDIDPSGEFASLAVQVGGTVFQRTGDAWANFCGYSEAGDTLATEWRPDGSLQFATTNSFRELRVRELTPATPAVATLANTGDQGALMREVEWQPGGALLVASLAASPYLKAWSWDGASTLSAVAVPNVLTAEAKGIAFNADGSLLAVGHGANVRLFSIAGTTITDEGNIAAPGGAPGYRSLAWEGDLLVVSYASSLDVYEQDSATSVAYLDTLAATSAGCPAWIADALLHAHGGTTRLEWWSLAGAAFTDLPDPAASGALAIRALAVWSDRALFPRGGWRVGSVSLA